jgi:hypothetical protein
MVIAVDLCMKNALFLVLVFLCLDAKAAESCQAIFRTEQIEFKTTALTQKEFDSIQSYEQLKAYTETLVLKKLDRTSLIIALEETQFAKKSHWWADDVLFFLLYLEVKQGLKIHSTEFPFQDKKLQKKDDIQNLFDLERYILTQVHTGKSPSEIADSLMTTSYVKSKNLQQGQIEIYIKNVIARMVQIKSWYDARFSDPEFINVFKDKTDGLEKIISEVMPKDKRDAEFVKLLRGDSEKNPDLSIIWRVNYPESPVQVASHYWRLRADKKITTDYVMDSNSETPYVSVSRFMGQPHPDQRFFENVYKNYQDRIRDEIIAQVKKVEEALPDLRQSYGLVFEGNNNQVIGTIRIFDGTPRRLNDIFVPERARVSPILPFEAIFKARDIPITFIKKLEKMRIEDAYTPVFEIV